MNNKATFGEITFDSTRDFDFENANAEFAKRMEASEHGEGDSVQPAYNGDNFFDSLTPDSAHRRSGQRGRGRGGRGYAPRWHHVHSDGRGGHSDGRGGYYTAPADGTTAPRGGMQPRGRGRGRGTWRGRGRGHDRSSGAAGAPPATEGQ